MSEVQFRGVSLSSLGNVYVSRMPSHKKASMRYSEYYVKGRDGALHVDEGLADYEIQLRVVLLNESAKLRQKVNAWADGTGKLITSDDLTLAYNATVKQEVVWTRITGNQFVKPFSTTKTYAIGDFCKYNGSIYRFKSSHTGAWNANDVDVANYIVNGIFDTADITFLCDPCMVEATDSVYEFTSSGTLTNPGSATAFPMIKVEGSGTCVFSVAGEEITLTSVVSGTPVYLDCAAGYVYTASGAREMTGNFPEIPLATPSAPTCAVVLTSGVSKLTITPHWRWV